MSDMDHCLVNVPFGVRKEWSRYALTTLQLVFATEKAIKTGS
jgi:hypothetical protein